MSLESRELLHLGPVCSTSGKELLDIWFWMSGSVIPTYCWPCLAGSKSTQPLFFLSPAQASLKSSWSVLLLPCMSVKDLIFPACIDVASSTLSALRVQYLFCRLTCPNSLYYALNASNSYVTCTRLCASCYSRYYLLPLALCSYCSGHTQSIMESLFGWWN
jgi:hypothetical protein